MNTLTLLKQKLEIFIPAGFQGQNIFSRTHMLIYANWRETAGNFFTSKEAYP